jgi:NADPH2:quinone reductase
MKAILMRAPGGTEVLEPAEVPTPAIADANQLLVRVHAAGLNPLDTKVRKLHFMYPDHLPAILGCDGAGVVERVGPAVTRFRPGDEVYFFNGGLGREPGTYAEYTLVHEAHAAAKPARLSMVEAAAVPLVLITAWEALYDRVALAQNETVLIHAGAGGVGHVAIQLARIRGARIATTVSDADKAAFARSLGAELTIDYRQEDFVAAAQRWTGGRGVDVVLDTVGGEPFYKSFPALRMYGRIATLLSTVCELADVNKARMRNLTVGLVQMTAPSFMGNEAARRAQTQMLEEAARLIDGGQLQVRVTSVLPLEDVAEGHRLLEQGHVVGKLVLRVT